MQGLKNIFRNFLWFDKRVFPIISITILLVMLLFLGIRHVQYRPVHDARFIANDVARLAEILRKIDTQCSILSFQYERVQLDFLTVKSFVSSEIGGLNLAYPENWQGPYIQDNPTMQEKVYEVVKASDGYYIVPGKGVKLPNGKVMGVEMVITPQSDVAAMIKKGGDLFYHDYALGYKIDFVIGDWPTPGKDSSDLLKEFGKAMTYTMAEE